MASPAELQTTETIGAEALFRAHASFVAGFLVRLGVRPADLDDLMQEVFVVAHRRGGLQPGPARPPTGPPRDPPPAALAHPGPPAPQQGAPRRSARPPAAGSGP